MVNVGLITPNHNGMSDLKKHHMKYKPEHIFTPT